MDSVFRLRSIPVMAMRNKYINCGKITVAKFRKFMYLFVHPPDAQKIVPLANLNRNTVNRYFL